MPCLSVDVQNNLDQACTGCESTILDNREEVHDFVVRLTLINSLEIPTEDACATVVDIFYNKKMIESVRFPSTHCAADDHVGGYENGRLQNGSDAHGRRGDDSEVSCGP